MVICSRAGGRYNALVRAEEGIQPELMEFGAGDAKT